MILLDSNYLINNTIVRPDFFFLSGFTGIPHTKYYYGFLCFVYALSLLGNSFVMFMIYTDHCLHSPKYIVVFNLALSDMCVSTTLVPLLIDTILLKSNLISYEACMTNMFFVYSFLTMQSLTLSLLSYDRYIAICFPLRYHEIVTNKSMFVLTTISWIVAAVATFIAVGFLTRLSFCKSVVINSYFCQHGPIFSLACNDNTPDYVINWTHPVVILWLPVLFIIGTYTCIAGTLSKIAATSERLKAMKTCSSHLILVCMFYFPLLLCFALGPIIDSNARMFSLSMATILPPMLNPLIYSLKTEEFMESVKKFYRRNKIHITVRNT